MMQRAVLWSTLNFFVSQGAGIVIFLIIAAQVPPHVFGVVALAAVAADFVAMEGRFAAMDAIIQTDRFDKPSLNSAFTSFLLLVLLIAVALFVSAPYAGAAYNEPLIEMFMPLFGLMLLPVPWIAVMDALMMRDLRYKQTTQRSIAATLIGGAVGIAMAFSPWLIWALFAQRLTSLVVGAGLLYRYTRWFPKLSIDWIVGADFIRRFLAIWLVSTLIITINRVTLIVFGIRYNIATVGLLRATNRIAEAVQGPIISPLMGLWFPLMAKVKGDVHGEREVYNGIVRTATLVALPAFSGLAVLSPEVVSVLLPAQYADVTPILRATSITMLQIPILWFNNVALNAMSMNKLSLAYTIALVVSSLVVLFAFPNVGPADAVLLMSIPCIFVGIAGNVILNRRLEQTNLAHFLGMAPAAFAALAMTGAILVGAYLLAGWPAAARLAACVVLGALVYVGWLLVFHRPWFDACIQLLLRGRKAA